MLKLGAKQKPQRIVLRPAIKAAKGRKAEPEAFIVMAPINGAMRRRSQAAMRRIMPAGVASIADLSADEILDLSEVASLELIRLGAIEWGGIGDPDGNPAPITPDRETRFRTASDPDRPTGTIDDLLADDALVAKIDAEYVIADAKRRAEKNGLSASPAGTGEAATRDNGTASSAAARKKPATPRKTAVAKNARTLSTRSKAKKRKASGRS